MNTSIMKQHIACRMCQKRTLDFVFSLGSTALANAFLTRQQLSDPEWFFPLDVYVCRTCSLVQLGHVVSPDVLFKNYVYVSSTSIVFQQYFEKYALEAYKRFNLGKNSFIIDIGSNDGILLKPFQSLGARVLGVEPAIRIAKQANQEGIETVCEYMTTRVARTVSDRYGEANIVTANNVFAHIDDLDEIVSSVKILLGAHGVFIIEAPYLVDFVENMYFDLVYHEHLSYVAVRPLIRYFERLGMEVFDVRKTLAHGGSIRIFVQKKGGGRSVASTVATFVHREERLKLDKSETFRVFAKKILKNKGALLNLLVKLKMKGKRIAGYGAPAKGNTFLSYFGIGKDMLDFIVDDSQWKQGLFTPGTHIPVISSRELYEQQPDYLLILAWNFAESIMKQHERFRKRGGKFIIPVPTPRVL